MKRISLLLVLLSSFTFIYSQINERNDYDWNALIHTGVLERNDSLFLFGIGQNSLGESAYFATVHDLIGHSEITHNGTTYYLNSSPILKGDELLSIGVNNSSSPGININQFSIPTNSYQLDSFKIADVSNVVVYDMVSNGAFSEFGIGNVQNASDLITNGFIVKTSNGDTLWTKKYSHPQFEVSFSSIKKISENRMLVGGRIYDWDYNSATIPEYKWDDEHHTYIAEMDTLGDIIWEWHDTTNFTWMPYALTGSLDGGVIYATQHGVHGPFNNILQGNFLTKLNASHEKEWEIQFDHYGGGDIGSQDNRMAEILQINDSTYVIGGSNATPFGENNTDNTITGTMLCFTDSGRIIWRRDVVPPVIEDSLQLAVIYDITRLSNGGFAMVGESRDSDGVGAYQQGWLLTTNCLGYLAPPSAACITGNLDNYCIRFANSSLQGGEFEWDFGDTEVQTTNEDEDTIVHVFPGEGPYNVRLIAIGCNGEADTIYFDVNPTLLGTDEQDEFGEGTFDVYPNPASNVAYVSFNILGELNNANIIITDLPGKTIQSVSVNQNEFTQELNLSNFSQGVYLLNFLNDGNLIKSRKLVVK